MTYSDEKIALIQKKSRLLKREKELKKCNHNVRESEVMIEQKEVTDVYDFEQEYFYDNQVSLLLPKDFFDSKVLMDEKIVWQKTRVMGMILARQELLEKDFLPVETLIKELQEQNRKQEFYVDFFDSCEQENDSLRKQIIASRIPTSKGYIYQKQVNLLRNQNWISLVITCFEKDRSKYENLLDYILDTLTIQGGDCIE